MTTATVTDTNDARQLYNVIKTIPAANLTASGFEKASAELSKKGKDNMFDSDERINGFKLMHAVAGQVSEAEFVEWLANGTQPEILKLSPAQMEQVRGGAIMLAVWAGIRIGSLVVGAYCMWDAANN